jgi:DNA-3-methyladenine glycosylase I
MRIAHYGRTASFSRVEGRVGATATASATEPAVPASPTGLDEKRCSFITPYSGNKAAQARAKRPHDRARHRPLTSAALCPWRADPLYVAYHDEEWGVPVHDDELLFEMLTLSGVQVGADWTSILKKRHVYRFGTEQHLQ